MTRHILPFFESSRPVFAKIDGLQAAGKIWKKGERFNWEFFGIPHDVIQTLFFQDYLHHNEELEEEVAKKVIVGDGLDDLSVEQLHIIVGKINAKVKEKTKNTSEFMQKKCAQSNIKNKQIGHIRKWRTSYGELEN